MTFAVLIIATIPFTILQSAVTPVLATIQDEMHTSQSTVTWVMTAYLLTASIATPILGRLGDIMGRKRVLVAVLAVLACGTLLAALASSIEVLLAARAIQGIGGAILPLAFGIIRDEFPTEKVAGGISALAAILAAGLGLGTVVAGPIVSWMSYHFLFWIPLTVIVLSVFAVAVLVPASKDPGGGRISVLPAVSLAALLSALLLAVSKGSQWRWSSPTVVVLLVVGVLLVPLWLLSEARADHPLVDVAMMRRRAVWATNVVALLFGVGMYSVFVFLPAFVQTPRAAGYGFGASVSESGLFLLPLTAAMFATGLLSTSLTNRCGAKVVVVNGSALTAASCALLVVAHDDRWAIFAFSAAVGAGLGFVFAAMANLIVDAVPASQVGVASGMNANIRTIGGAVGTATTATLVTANAMTDGTPVEAGYVHGFVFLCGSAVLATLVAFAIPATRRASRQVTGDEDQGGRPRGIVIHGQDSLIAGAPLVERAAAED
ncbi:MFS transporter [Mycolicibacterium sp. P9-64]|nr:MFS transporter [Mycolicibacterium sp. P9-64]